MAGRNRLKRLTHDELIAELKACYEDAAGWVSEAEAAERQSGIEPALGPIHEAGDLLFEARRRWRQACRLAAQLDNLLARCRRLTRDDRYGRQLAHQVETLAARCQQIKG